MASEQISVDGAVDREKLDELRAVAGELDELDFKRHLDLGKGSTKSRLEFVKDVAAFSTTPSGGYLVIGVDGSGAVATEHPSIEPAHFDPATLVEIAESFIDAQLDVRAAVHLVDGRPVALVFIGSTRDGLPAVMSKDGTFTQQSGKPSIIFRRGDVFTRNGTRSRRVEHRDWPRVLSNYRARLRAEAASDTQEVIARVAEMLRESTPASALPVVIDVGMALSDFEDAIADAIERGELNAIRRALRPARRALTEGWKDADHLEGVLRLLDRLAAVAGVAVRHRNLDVFSIALDELHRAYRAALEDPTDTYPSNAHPRAAAIFWREIAARLIAILGAAVREEAWAFVRPLALRPIGTRYIYASWLRHAVTEASRNEVLASDRNDRRGATSALVRFARASVQHIPSLHDDVMESAEHDVESEPSRNDELLNSMCQADFLWCVVVVAEAGGQDEHGDVYPSCAGLYPERTIPIAERIARDQRMREETFGQPDAVIARSVVIVDDLAATQSAWRRWSVRTPAVESFLRSVRA